METGVLCEVSLFIEKNVFANATISPDDESSESVQAVRSRHKTHYYILYHFVWSEKKSHVDIFFFKYFFYRSPLIYFNNIQADMLRSQYVPENFCEHNFNPFLHNNGYCQKVLIYSYINTSNLMGI